jgi:hypothetical protein
LLIAYLAILGASDTFTFSFYVDLAFLAMVLTLIRMQVRAPIICPKSRELDALLHLWTPSVAWGGASETEVDTTAGITASERTSLASLLVQVLLRVTDVGKVRIVRESYVLP